LGQPDGNILMQKIAGQDEKPEGIVYCRPVVLKNGV